MKINKIAVAALMGAALLTSAYADDIQPFTADWSGTSFTNSTTATATFDLDLTLISVVLGNNTGGTNSDSLDGFISDLSLTVSGASVGNGTFTTSDFYAFFIETGGPVDFSSDLVPQSNFEDFNLFSDSGPSAYEQEALATDYGEGDPMQLISLTPAPEPSTLALAGLGALSSLFLFRRRKWFQA